MNKTRVDERASSSTYQVSHIHSTNTICSITAVACKNTTYGNGIPPEPNLCWCRLNTLDQSLHSALVLGSIRGMNRWDNKWLPLSRSSMLHNIGGARTRTFFKLTNRWRRDIFSVVFWGVFRVEECIKLILHPVQKWLGSIQALIWYIKLAPTQVRCGRYAVFRKASFLPLETT